MNSQKKPIFVIYETPTLLLLKIMMLMFLSDVVFFVMDLLFDIAEGSGRIFAMFSATEELFLGIIIFHVVLMSYLFLEWVTNFYWFENGVLHHRKGILWRRTQRFILSDIKTTSFFQNMPGRMFHYGSVTMAFSTREVTLRRIPHPEVFVKMIEAEIERVHSKQLAPTP